MNTGMPSSGPMIVDSIRKLGFKPEDIKLLINGHAHIDHAGAFAFFKEQFGAQLAVMKDDVAAMESGDREDFKYANDFVYSGVKVDRVVRDGDKIRMGDVLLTAYRTPGTPAERPRGSRTSSSTASPMSWRSRTAPDSIPATGWSRTPFTQASPTTIAARITSSKC